MRRHARLSQLRQSGGPPPDAGRVVGVGQTARSLDQGGDRYEQVSTLHVVSKDRAPELTDLPDEVRLALSEAASSAREGLLALSVATGLTVMHAMMQAEITDLAGPKGKHDPDRAVPHGAATSF